MKDIRIGDEVYAILASVDSLKPGAEWFGNQFEPLQASRMNYPIGKKFAIHHHRQNPRIIKRTQESFVVVSGRIAVDIYNERTSYLGPRASFLGTLEVGPGEAIFIYRGGHGVRVLEDCVFFEVKAGQFDGVVSEEKTFQED